MDLFDLRPRLCELPDEIGELSDEWVEAIATGTAFGTDVTVRCVVRREVAQRLQLRARQSDTAAVFELVDGDSVIASSQVASR